MGQHGSISTEIRLRTDDLKHLVRPEYVKGLTRADIGYARPMFGSEPLHGQEVLAIVRRFRHHIHGSGSFLSGKWEALTYDLAAVQGTLDDAQFSFHGVTTHLFDRFLDCSSQGNDAKSHLFVLGPGELVRGIDLAWNDRKLAGLRVQTNQRQSQWFGQRLGVVKTVTAPQGYFINAIEKLRTNPNELAIRLCPITEHLLHPSLGVSCVAQEKSPCVGTPTEDDGPQTEFAEMHDHVRALVVKCGDGIADLHVLSPEMFSRHLAKREEPLPSQDHLFFLRHGEILTAVEVLASDRVWAMRLHTNLTKSAWYGTRDQDTVGAMHCFKVPETKLQICGFHGTFGRTALGSVGVFYGAIPVSVAVEHEHPGLLKKKAID